MARAPVRLLHALLLAVVCLAGPGQVVEAAAAAGRALQPITLRLDWIYQGPNSGFMAAREKGF
jgi:ABC-type nitrate/sulfonate/bicarbonate transport system substrate-binding protein